MRPLTLISGTRRIRVVEPEMASIGREPGATVEVHDERVSRRHALVKAERGQWIYEDLASSNGSFLDNVRIQRISVDHTVSLRLGNASDGPLVTLQLAAARPRVLRAAVVAAMVLIAVGAIAGSTARFVSVQAGPSPSAVSTLAPERSAAPSSRTEIVAAGKLGTVLIVQGNGQGSGAYIGNDRVLTALHVVPTTGRITVTFNDRQFAVSQVLGRDERDDLALLLVPGLDGAGARALTWGNSDRLREGDELVVLGYPAGLPFSVKVGVVSGLREDTGTKLIQTDASTNPGMSGGPALDPSGALVGITDFGYARYPGLNFLVASTTARDFVENRR